MQLDPEPDLLIYNKQWSVGSRKPRDRRVLQLRGGTAKPSDLHFEASTERYINRRYILRLKLSELLLKPPPNYQQVPTRFSY